MGTRVLTYRREYTGGANTVGSLDGTVNLDVPLDLSSRNQSIRLISCSFSSNIPNIYTANGFTNTVIGVSRDNFATTLAITLPMGVYSISMINAAIASATTTAGWWLAGPPLVVGITLAYNTATDIVYADLDSTRLAVPGQLGLDFGYTIPGGAQSQLWSTLGFSTPALGRFAVDGLTSAQLPAQLDVFTSDLHLLLDGFGSLGVYNNTQSNLFAVMSLISDSGATPNSYIFPKGQQMPTIKLWNPSTRLASYGIRLQGSNGRPCVWLNGGYIELQFVLAAE